MTTKPERQRVARGGRAVPPLVSILIPAYNAERWISDTIESAVSQTWPRTEIIVVDDGSKDATLEIARRWASGTVHVVSQRNQGAAAARNAALSLSQGSYIQWLDADDLLAVDKISRQMEVLTNCSSRKTLSSSAWGRFLYRPDAAEFVDTSLWRDLQPVEWLMRKMIDNVYMQTSAWLVTRELTEAAGPWDQRLLGDDDGEYFARVIAQADAVLFVRGSRVFYRRAGFNSLSAIGLSDAKMNADLHSVRLQIGYLRELEDSERVRRACVAYLQHSLDHYYPARLDLIRDAQALAAELGGDLTMPRFSWKYGWLDSLFGPSVAQRGQMVARRLRWMIAGLWDKALLRLDHPRAALRRDHVLDVDATLARVSQRTH